MKLYLVRHGVAYEHGDPDYPNDDDRPLTPKGRKQFKRAAEGLLELVGPPAAILTSPLPRALQTAEILCVAAGESTGALVMCEALLPGGSFDEVVQACRAQVESAGATGVAGTNAALERGLALVGHAPSIGLLAAWLLSGDTAAFALSFEKGGAAGIAFDDLPAPGLGDLEWLATPRMLRRMRP